jgi:hypothetical protein
MLCLALPGCDRENEQPSKPLASDPGFDGLGSVFKAVSEAPDGPSRLVYVPVYSRLFLSEASYWELASSLSIRNTDPDQSIVVYRIDYYDTAGNLLQKYLETTHELGPMATVTLTLPQSDVRGGAGANFLVRWSGDNDINEPIIEVVMAGIRGTQSFSFIGSGQEIVE